jgi:predicted ATPase/transcriptional regulator with XRE-family HTH domain
MDAPTSIGAWIRQRRRALDMTQEALAECVGLSVSAVRKIESDERRPSLQVAELLVEGLQINDEQRIAFLKAARGELSISHSQVLATRAPLPPPPVAQPASPVLAQPLARPPVATGVQRSTLPAPATPLVGRTNELLQLEQLLRDPTCRLLTIVGAGGSGKTRLAIEMGRRASGLFANGAHFVALVSVHSPALIATTIATTIGLGLHGASDPSRQLVDYLHDKQMLLVLDNLEHLLEPPPANGATDLQVDLLWLAELVSQAAQLKLIITSREPLSLAGEWLFDLQGLPVPSLGTGETQAEIAADVLEQVSSVELFTQAARRADARFLLAPADRAAVARICRLVDGLPLAIELAASWVRTLTCTEIAAEIERNLDFLATSARGVPERHRSMTAVFDHSWRLLGEQEQQVLRRLSVLRGSFSREAAQEIAGARLPVLSTLVAKSLIRHTDQGRYELHELVRQYLAVQLQNDPQEALATQERHGAYFLYWLHQRAEWLRSDRQRSALADFTTDADNIRAAWNWAVQQRRTDLVKTATADLVDFYDWLSWFQEAERLFAQAVQQVEGPVAAATSPADHKAGDLLGYLLLGYGAFACRVGQYTRAEQELTRSLELLYPDHYPPALMRAYYWLTMVTNHLGKYEGAQHWGAEGLALAEQGADANMMARILNLLGFASLFQGQYAQAEERFGRSLALARQLGNQNLTILLLTNLSWALRLQQKYDQTRLLLQESIRLALAIGERRLLAFGQAAMGRLAFELGDYSAAQEWFQQSLQILRMIHETWAISGVLNDLGQATLALGDSAAARQTFDELLRLAVEAGLPPRVLDALVGLAHLHLLAGEDQAALTALTHVIHHNRVQRETKERAERLLQQLANRLAPEQMAQLQDAAQEIPFEMLLAQYTQSEGECVYY